MSVSIHAYSHLQLTEPHKFDPDACYGADHTRAFAYPSHHQSFRGLADADQTFDGYGDARFIGGRCYQHTDDSDHALVMSTSYGGYSRWREALSRAVHGVEPNVIWSDADRYRDAPFFELIRFADNEGCIGPDAAADLYEDFVNHARQLAGLARVDAWLEGLSLAANDGLIEYR